MSSFPKVNTNNREMIVWTYWSHVHISIRAQTFLESAEETVESSPMETVPTTLAEAGFHLVVVSPRDAIPVSVPPPSVETSPPVEDDSSSDGPPELVDYYPSDTGDLFPRLAHSDSSSQDSE